MSFKLSELNEKLKSVSLITDYEKNIINKDLFKFYAEEYGKRFKDISSNQIRKFYDEIVSLLNQLDVPSGNFETLYPMILMLKSKVAYSAGKETSDFKKSVEKALKKGKKPEEWKKKKIQTWDEFNNFIKILVKMVNNSSPEKGEKDFRALKLFFEAVVGYYTFYNK